MPLQAVR